MLFGATHFMSLRGAKRRENPPEGLPYKTPRKILLYLRGEKGANKHKSEHCRPDNAISTAQFAPGTLYEFWEMLVFAGKNLKKRMKIFEYVH